MPSYAPVALAGLLAAVCKTSHLYIMRHALRGDVVLTCGVQRGGLLR